MWTAPGMMTSEQAGEIILLARDIDEETFNAAVEFVREPREKHEAKEMIQKLEQTINA
jgi:hypothetical protein